ncbi:thermonuclease family protein [Mesorhizobium australicum]|uniref:Endonuclease YncB, thermonuclease family n=1 Tax=Mesorhizobium australicum TaxID=536018 RepID=A0A1X7P8B8_9HYPH|nr:thermonuclease family protein [Mesorhizobium australicum]SMH47300.1 Endonuclease YncB, thermonuclease family [Mesorhizobium australicum]
MRRMQGGGRYRPRRATYRRSAGRRYAEYALTFVLFMALALVAARLDRTQTVRPEGRAVVNDGDTITLAGERIRLRGIDAPEYDQTCTRAGASYPCGRQSRRELERLVAGRSVACEGWERDKYDRLLAVCRAGDIDLNRRLVEEGWAIAYGDYADAERAARAAAKGIWAGEFDRPRAWRELKGGVAEAEHSAMQTIFNWIRQVLGW